MAKVTNPLHSDKASGVFAKIMVYTCGVFARSRPTGIKRPITLPVTLLFKEGAERWTKELTPEVKKQWKDFVLFLKMELGDLVSYWIEEPKCIPFKVVLTIFGIKAWPRMSGFSAWIQYYNKYGYFGWPQYPYPPAYPPGP